MNCTGRGMDIGLLGANTVKLQFAIYYGAYEFMIIHIASPISHTPSSVAIVSDNPFKTLPKSQYSINNS